MKGNSVPPNLNWRNVTRAYSTRQVANSNYRWYEKLRILHHLQLAMQSTMAIPNILNSSSYGFASCSASCKPPLPPLLVMGMSSLGLMEANCNNTKRDRMCSVHGILRIASDLLASFRQETL